MLILLAGCGEAEQAALKRTEQETLRRIKNELKSSGTITDEDAEHLDQRHEELCFSGDLTSITNKQAESLSKAKYLRLNGLTSITDEQAKMFSKANALYLDGLDSITDEQAESLSKIKILALSGLTSITDEQVTILSKLRTLSFNGLRSITDKQAESLSKVRYLYIPTSQRPAKNSLTNTKNHNPEDNTHPDTSKNPHLHCGELLTVPVEDPMSEESYQC